MSQIIKYYCPGCHRKETYLKVPGISLIQCGCGNEMIELLEDRLRGTVKTLHQSRSPESLGNNIHSSLHGTNLARVSDTRNSDGTQEIPTLTSRANKPIRLE